MNLRRHRAAVAAACLVLFAPACSGDAESVAAAVDVAPAADAPAAADPAAEVATTAPVEPAPAPAEAEPAEAAPAEPTTAESESAEPASEPAAPAPDAVAITLPDVEVYDLSSGQTAALASFARPGATLVWFWAPH